jgi:hypothetical protein
MRKEPNREGKKQRSKQLGVKVPVGKWQHDALRQRGQGFGRWRSVASARAKLLLLQMGELRLADQKMFGGLLVGCEVPSRRV